MSEHDKCTRCQVVKGILGIVLIFFLGNFAYNYFTSPKSPPAAPMQVATVLNNPRMVHPFELKDDSGAAFTEANLKKQWSILFFGFTKCPMMCPTAMAELGKVYQLLQMQGVKHLPQVIMISIDPNNDTVADMRRYVKKFDPHFIGLTGEENQVKKLTQELGIVYLAADKESAEAMGAIDHSGTFVLINPNGEAQAFFSFPHDAQKIAGDYRQITENQS